MSKTSEATLVKGTQEALTAYLKKGKLNKSYLDNTLDLDGLDINDFERLKRIHFVLSEDITNFMEQLPDHLRAIKTESRREQKISRGEIKGRINWGRTFKERYTQNYNDRSVFVTQNPDIEYNIPENLVLKKLLAVIHEVVTEELKNTDHKWRKDTWPDQTIEDLEQIFNRNVHINRIKDADKIDLTPRDLKTAKDSRQPVYRQAHRHYRTYQKIMNDQFHKDEVEDLFENTVIIPDKPTLFELYSIFNIIKMFENEDWKLETIERGSKPLVRLEKNGSKISIFHDSQGELEFREEIDLDTQYRHTFIKKSKEIKSSLKKASQKFYGKEKEHLLYEDVRPDMVIEYWREERLEKVVIGEIKYTDNKETFAKGLEQLIEYMKFAKYKDKYIEERDTELKGVLIADSFKPDKNRFEKDPNITALETSDIKNDSSSDMLRSLVRPPKDDN